MKCLLLCVLFASSVLSVLADKEYVDKIEKIENDCIKEANADYKAIDVPLDKMTKEGKCALACVYKKTDLMKVDGTIDLKVVKLEMEKGSEFPNNTMKELYVRALEECTNEVQPVPNDTCETAYNWILCHQKKLLANKKE